MVFKFYLQEPVATTPTLILNRCRADNPLNFQGLHVNMDNEIVIIDNQDMEITDVLACVFSIYFIYGIEYPKELKNTLMFMENYLFNVKQPGKIPIRVLKMHNFLRLC